MKVFVVPYFGHFPDSFQLWLDSCSNNSDFTWLLITDSQLGEYCIPDNVLVRQFTLDSIRELFQDKLGISISLSSPYKLCDFRPVYWILLDYFKIKYNFWGYCDLDVVFGRLSKFITEEILQSYDKIYSNGHLTLLSASPISKYSFMYDGAETNWRKVFTNPQSFGFDEHHGINRIWKKQRFLYYDNSKDVADIAPQFDDLRLTYIPLNKKKHFFVLENDAIYQGYWKDGVLELKEFAYIHLQKRKLAILYNKDEKPHRLLFTNDSLQSIETLPNSYSEIEPFLSKQEKMISYEINKIRACLRFYKQKVYLGKL